MKIGLISQGYPPDTPGGGIGTQTHLKAHGLARRGHRVRVISSSVDATEHRVQDGAVSIIRIPHADAHLAVNTEAVRWLTYSMQVAVAIQALHAEDPFDILDFPEWGGEGFVHLLNQTPWNEIPTVVHLQGPLVMLAHSIGWPGLDSELFRIGTVMEGACLRLAHAVFSSSRCSADWAMSHYGIDARLIPVLHAGVDTTRFRPAQGPKEERPTIIFIGRIARSKGADVLARAACTVADRMPALQVFMLGGQQPDVVKEISTYTAASGHRDLIHMVGPVAREDLPHWLNRAHVFAAPSLYEGGPGFVYLEAMACGLPVIGTSGSGIEEVVVPGVNGLLVPPGDDAALAEALLTLLQDPERTLRMGRQAREYVLAEAETEACVERLEAFYLTVMQKSHDVGHPP